MKKIIIAIIFLAISLNNINYAQSYTLDEVIKLTVQNHPLIKQKEDELRSIGYKIEQQKSFYLPEVSGRASYTRIGPIPAFAFGGEAIELAPANNYNAAILVHQTLYDFGKRDLMVDYTASFLNSIKDNEEQIKYDLSNLAIKIFYGIIFIEKTIAVKDTQFAALEEHLKVTELKIKNGTATDYDLLSTKTKMIEIKNEKLDLQNEMNKQKIHLKELIGTNRNEEIAISGEFSLPYYGSNSDSLLNIAFMQRPEIKLIADSRNSDNIRRELLSKNDKPVFNADISYGFKNGYEPNIEVMRGNWAAAVSVAVPIFNGNLTESKVNEASAAIDASDKKLEQVKELISTDIYQAISDLKTEIKKINYTKEQIEYARRSLDRAKIRYERGAATNLEVLDAETVLTQARLLKIQSLYKTIINYYSLRRAAGDKIF